MWHIPLQVGVVALWRGWVPSVIGVVPYVGLNFAVYETLKEMVLSHYGMPSIQHSASFLLQGSPGAFCTLQMGILPHLWLEIAERTYRYEAHWYEHGSG